MKKSLLVISLLVIFISAASSLLLLNSYSKELISPFITQQKVLGVNLWLPAIDSEEKSDLFQISAKSTIFLDSKGGEVLYSKNAKEKLPVASLVKIMTVLIALEHKAMDDKFSVSFQASEMEPDKMLLIAGEQLSLKELLYGIFLVSANDAAEVLAEGTTGSREEFLSLMNSKAKQLGMEDTYFANPTGLDEDVDNSYSTAYDLAILTRYLIRNYPEIVDISSKEHIFLPHTLDHQDYEMYSGINLLTTYPGVVGFKTGYTPLAGYTLVTLAKRDEYEIIGVILGSADRRNEARVLLDYSFSKMQ